MHARGRPVRQGFDTSDVCKSCACPGLIIKGSFAILGMHFSTFTLALMIGWIFSVCLHEFAHALVAYWGGDRSARTRGYLRMNPLDYVDPVTSLLLPCVLLLLGGIPFPGGAVRIRRDLLRGPGWSAAVSAAGPAANILLVVVLMLMAHPAMGLIPAEPPYRTWQRFIGVMIGLQLDAIASNRVRVPPLDGCGMLGPSQAQRARLGLRVRPMGYAGFLAVFVLLCWVPGVSETMFSIMSRFTDRLGLEWDLLYNSYNLAFFGSYS